MFDISKTDTDILQEDAFLIDSALLFEALHAALYTMDSAFYLSTHMFGFWDLFATVTTQSGQILQTSMLLYQIKKIKNKRMQLQSCGSG